MKNKHGSKTSNLNFSEPFPCPDLGIKFLYGNVAQNPNLRSNMSISEGETEKNEKNYVLKNSRKITKT